MRITGKIDTNEVWVDGKPLYIERSRRLMNHSFDFSWGYGGSGPAQLALALLLHVTNDQAVSMELYQEFKWDVVCNWPQADIDMNVDIKGWVTQRVGSHHVS